MITNLDTQPFHLIHKMSMTKFNFYLTGSRYFGNATASSDWDFFVKVDDKVKEWMFDNDFRRIPMHPDWLDLNTSGIFRNKHVPIEIALVEDVDLKVKAQQFLFSHPHMLTQPGVDMRNVWNSTYKVIDNVR